MPRSFLIKKKSADFSCDVNGDVKRYDDVRQSDEVDTSSNQTIDYSSKTKRMTSATQADGHTVENVDSVNIRIGGPEELIDKNGNKNFSDEMRYGDEFKMKSPMTVVPAVRRSTIWSPAADLKAEVDAAAAAVEMAVKLLVKTNGLGVEAAMTPFTPLTANMAASLNGIGKFNVDRHSFVG